MINTDVILTRARSPLIGICSRCCFNQTLLNVRSYLLPLLLTMEMEPCPPFCSADRGFHPVVRRQHVHEGGDPGRRAHGGGGRLAALHVSAGLWPADGRHLPRVCRHAQARAGQRPGQADGQPRYRMSRPRGPRSTRAAEETSLHAHTLSHTLNKGVCHVVACLFSDLPGLP